MLDKKKKNLTVKETFFISNKIKTIIFRTKA